MSGTPATLLRTRWTIYEKCACGWSGVSWYSSQQSLAHDQARWRPCPRCGKCFIYSSMTKGKKSRKECEALYNNKHKE